MERDLAVELKRSPEWDGARLVHSHMLAPLLGWVAGAFLFETTDLDPAASDWFYDFGARRWMGVGRWWANELLHTGGKWLILLIAGAALTVFLLSYRRAGLRTWRSAALYVVLSIGLTTGLVAIGKAVTDRHCPREIDRWGGSIPYTPLFQGTPAGYPAGHCFPAGHASGPLSLFCLYFVARARRTARPALLLLPPLLLGSAYALGQQARGAHFLSHNLWTMGIAWFVALGLARVFGEDRLGKFLPRS
jgi:membrane-associated PAP2 superfamily phosphatase